MCIGETWTTYLREFKKLCNDYLLNVTGLNNLEVTSITPITNCRAFARKASVAIRNVAGFTDTCYVHHVTISGTVRAGGTAFGSMVVLKQQNIL